MNSPSLILYEHSKKIKSSGGKKSLVKNFIIGKVPDRGGRLNEMRPNYSESGFSKAGSKFHNKPSSSFNDNKSKTGESDSKLNHAKVDHTAISISGKKNTSQMSEKFFDSTSLIHDEPMISYSGHTPETKKLKQVNDKSVAISSNDNSAVGNITCTITTNKQKSKRKKNRKQQKNAIDTDVSNVANDNSFQSHASNLATNTVNTNINLQHHDKGIGTTENEKRCGYTNLIKEDLANNSSK
jgi:hypothetical protein